MKPHQCYGFRDDIILCSPGGEEAADILWPIEPELKRAIDELVETGQVATCDPSQFGCHEAKRRRKCAESVVTEADMRYLTNDMCSAYTEEQAIAKGLSVSSMRVEVYINRRAAKTEGGSMQVGALNVHNLKNGIADLNYFQTYYQGNLRQGSLKPRDTTSRQGLHNFVTFMSDHILSLSYERDNSLTPKNKHYRALHKYSDQELDSGKEWNDALTKSMLIYAYEAITRMHSNTSFTIAAYVVVVFVLAVQYLLLGVRMGDLMEDYAGMSTLITRLSAEASKLKPLHEPAMLNARLLVQEVAGSSDGSSSSDSKDSTKDVSDDHSSDDGLDESRSGLDSEETDASELR